MTALSDPLVQETLRGSFRLAVPEIVLLATACITFLLGAVYNRRWLWFLVSGAVPIFGLMAAVLYRNENAEERRACPGCGKVVFLHDTKCMRCGAELYYPESEEEILPSVLSAGR